MLALGSALAVAAVRRLQAAQLAARLADPKRRKSDQTSSRKIDFWLDLLKGNSARKFGNSPEGP